MTVLDPVLDRALDRPGPPVAARAVARTGVRAADLAEHATVGLALVWWAVPLTHGTGGREPWLLTVGLLLLVPAFFATRAWRRAPGAALALSAAVPLAALGVCAFARTGWAGAGEAASYTYAAALVPVLLAYLRTPQRRLALAGVVCVAAMEQFARAFQPWWGGGDPARPMVGTFYWHNQYAAFLVPAVLLGLGAVTARARPVATIGWLAVPLCAAGVVFSTSRATMACLALGVLLLLAAASPLLAGSAREGLTRCAAAIALAAAVVLVLPGPPLFAHRSAPLASTSARAENGQSLGQNGEQRVLFWREAVTVAEHHPVAGAGFHSFATATNGLVPKDWPSSPLVHNGYLQAAADGGALLAVPFWAACALIGAGLLRRLRHARRAGAERWLAVAAPLAGLALLGHSFVDFDWSYPALFALAAVVCALGLSIPVSRRSDDQAVRRTGDDQVVRRTAGNRWRYAAAAALLGLVATFAGLATGGGLHLTAHPNVASGR